jgi:predicted DNA-binding protein (UPF0251 family)
MRGERLMSPRRKIQRKCRCPFKKGEGLVFKPAGTPLTEIECVEIFLDELEAVRLCDLEDKTQEAAGEKMGISRGTVQRLLYRGRKKIIDALVHSKALIVRNQQ